MKKDPVRTPVTVSQLAAALRAAGLPEAAVPLAVAHSALETGWWAQCWCWNLGNAKAREDEPHCYRGADPEDRVGEELPPGMYAGDPRVRVEGPSKRPGLVSYRFFPDHPQTRFRAYGSLEEAVEAHLAMLRRTFPRGWSALQAGEPAAYVDAIAGEGYFTAPAAQYRAGVVGCLDRVRRELAMADTSLIPPDQWRYLVPRERLCAIVRWHAGCSFTHRYDELRALVGRDFPETAAADVDADRGAQAARLQTNCGTTALGVLARACIDADRAGHVHKLLTTPMQIGLAVTWLMMIGWETRTLAPYKDRSQLRPGNLVRYYSGNNNDHVEWILSEVDERGVGEHGGGGRPGNEITVGTGNVLTSMGRPIVHVWDFSEALPSAEQRPEERDRIQALKDRFYRDP